MATSSKVGHKGWATTWTGNLSPTMFHFLAFMALQRATLLLIKSCDTGGHCGVRSPRSPLICRLGRPSKPSSSKGGETSEQAIGTGADGHLSNGRLADEEDNGGMQPVRGGKELSQRELIARAFAGDDVQAEFAEEKAREAEAEAAPADAPLLLPGWGAWAGQQRTPGWMAKAQDKALRCGGLCAPA